jgi:hypothetical protein
VTTSAAKAKGSAFERDVAAYLRDHGFPYAERTMSNGSHADVGDLTGVPGVVIECKSHASIDLAGFCDEAERERVNAGAQLGVVVVKRRGKGVDQAYMVVPLSAGVRLLGP